MNFLSIIILSTLSWSNPEIDTTAIDSVDITAEIQLECIVENNLIDTLIYTGTQLIGTPYRYGGATKKGFDCSGLVGYIFGSMGAEVGRTSRDLSELGYEINIDEVTKGDLVFFKGRNANSNAIGHVAYVIGGEGEEMILLHATSRGVIADEISKMSYYKKRFLFAKRPQYEELFELF